MPAIIQRGRAEYLKGVDINDLKRLPEENKQLRQRVQTQELQLAEKSKEAHQLQVELASERGLRQGVELGVTLALQAQAQLMTSGIEAGYPKVLPLQRKYLERLDQGHVESESLSSCSGSVKPSSSVSVRGSQSRTARSSVSHTPVVGASMGPSSSVSGRGVQPEAFHSSFSHLPSASAASKSLHSSRFPKPPRDTLSTASCIDPRRSISDSTRPTTPRSASVFSADRRVSSLPECLSTLALSDGNHNNGPIDIEYRIVKKEEKNKVQRMKLRG